MDNADWSNLTDTVRYCPRGVRGQCPYSILEFDFTTNTTKSIYKTVS